MKKIVFSIVILLLISYVPLRSQTDFCGVFPPHQAQSSDPDSIYYDRFGNTYDLPDPNDQTFSAISGTVVYTDHFALDFDFDVPSEVKTLVVNVFTDFENLLEDFISINSCGDTYESEVLVRIGWNSLDGGTLARATAYYEGYPSSDLNCHRVLSNQFWAKFFTPRSGFNRPDGVITINQDYEDEFYNELGDCPSDKYDLYSIILHEVGHLAGFGSMATSPIIGSNTFSPYDLLLYGNGVPFYFKDCEEECYQSNFTEAQIISMLANNNNCDTGSPNVLLNNLIPIHGDDMATPNTISHLNGSCPNSNDYVMQPFIGYGDERRTYTNDEFDIFCSLDVPLTQCAANDAFYIQKEAILEDVFNNGDYDVNCCTNIESVCAGESITITVDQLLCNDYGDNLDIIGVQLKSNQSEFGTVTFDGVNVEFQSAEDAAGNLAFLEYTVTNGNCEFFTSRVEVLITLCSDFNNLDPCENICGLDGFEGLGDRNITNGGAGFDNIFMVSTDGIIQNSPDACFIDNNNYVSIGYYKASSESITIKLAEPIHAGCTMQFEVKGLARYPNTSLLISGTTDEPCNVLQATYPLDHCEISIDCAGTPSQLHCLSNPGDIILADMDTGNGPCDFTPSMFQTYQFEWSNELGVDINYLNIAVTSDSYQFVAIDDVVVTRDCGTPAFTYNTSCKTAYFTAESDNAGIQHIWDFGDTNTSVEANPLHTYDANGTYQVTHTIITDCDTKSETQQIEISCIETCTVGFDMIFFDAAIQDKISFYSSAGAIPQGNISDVTIMIDGAFRIDEDYRFDDCTIYMMPGSEIIKDEDILLTFRGCSILACENMWKGITVNAGGYLDFQDGNVISDAEHAIKLLPGSTKIIENNIFDRNFIGVYSPPHSFPKTISGPPIVSNQFLCTDNLKPPYVGQQFFDSWHSPNCNPGTSISFAGILLHDVSTMRIGSNVSINESENISNKNIFSGLKNGVLAVNTGITVAYNEFSNLQGLQGHMTYNASDVDFLYASAGVGVGVQDIRSTTVDHNNINTGMAGVSVINGMLSKVIVTNNEFTNFSACGGDTGGRSIQIYDVSQSTIEVNNNDMNASDFGIIMDNINSPASLDVLDNNYTYQGSNYYVDGMILNNISCTDNPGFISGNIIEISNASDSYEGITMNSCTALEVSQNTITLDQSSGSYSGNAVLEIKNSSQCHFRDNDLYNTANTNTSMKGMTSYASINNLYCCNYVEGTPHGFYFSGQNVFTNFSSNTMYEEGSLKSGLTLDEGIIGPQSTKGNIWSGDMNMAQIISASGNQLSLAGSSRFSVNEDQNDAVNDRYVRPQTIEPMNIENDWFQPDDEYAKFCDDPDPEAALCFVEEYDLNDPDNDNGDIDNPDIVDEFCVRMTDIYQAVINGQTTSEYYLEPNLWSATMQLLDHYTEAELQQRCLVLYQFFIQTGIIGPYSETDREIREGNLADSTLLTQANTLLQNIDQLEASIAALYVDFSTADLPILDQYLSDLAVANTDLDNITQTIQSQAQTVAAALPAQITGLDESYAFLPYIKAMFWIKTKILDTGINSLTTGDWDAVRDIANLCPLSHGGVVYEAQALLLRNGEIFDASGDPCANTQKRELNTPDVRIKALIHCYPNPASDQITVDISGKHNMTSRTIRISDMIGNVVFEQILDKDASRITINTGEYPSGIYMVQYLEEDIIMDTKRVSIIE